MKGILIILTALVSMKSNVVGEIKENAKEQFIEGEQAGGYHDYSVDGTPFEKGRCHVRIGKHCYMVDYWYSPDRGLEYIFDECTDKCEVHSDGYHYHDWDDANVQRAVEITDEWYGEDQTVC